MRIEVPEITVEGLDVLIIHELLLIDELDMLLHLIYDTIEQTQPEILVTGIDTEVGNEGLHNLTEQQQLL